jgi:hypothetical protein
MNKGITKVFSLCKAVVREHGRGIETFGQGEYEISLAMLGLASEFASLWGVTEDVFRSSVASRDDMTLAPMVLYTHKDLSSKGRVKVQEAEACPDWQAAKPMIEIVEAQDGSMAFFQNIKFLLKALPKRASEVALVFQNKQFLIPVKRLKREADSLPQDATWLVTQRMEDPMYVNAKKPCLANSIEHLVSVCLRCESKPFELTTNRKTVEKCNNYVDPCYLSAVPERRKNYVECVDIGGCTDPYSVHKCETGESSLVWTCVWKGGKGMVRYYPDHINEREAVPHHLRDTSRRVYLHLDMVLTPINKVQVKELEMKMKKTIKATTLQGETVEVDVTCKDQEVPEVSASCDAEIFGKCMQMIEEMHLNVSAFGPSKGKAQVVLYSRTKPSKTVAKGTGSRTVDAMLKAIQNAQENF